MSDLLGFIGLRKLDISGIRHAKRNLRNDYGPLDELMASIKEKGLLQPIIVRAIDEYSFEVVAGNRRLEACRKLGFRKIVSHIVELDDKEAFEVSLVENVQQRSLNPLEEAVAYSDYVARYGYGGISELARRIGKSQEYVSRRLQLLQLPPKVREQVMRRGITVSAAEELGHLGGIAETIGEMVHKHHLSVRQIRGCVKEYLRTKSLDPQLFPDVPHNSLSNAEIKLPKIERITSRSIASIRICMMRLAECINELEDDGPLYEILMQYRQNMNSYIDSLYKIKKKMRRVRNLKPLADTIAN